ncbi:hypothetical protein [Desulfatirhabdium butyrativorans]|uniref:hypothetical protein n=1 Tax=Desulfatirhabdium butyrativorans TaxID=340467 RepID=UPI000420604B|nr:hypothetical protein [Desulfatirhabdium butyrativorans]
MKRSRKVVVLCHCLLNANVKVHALATYPGIFPPVVAEFLEPGIGILQLPCPETTFLGLNRWGMTREQYDIPAYRRHCRRILIPPISDVGTLEEESGNFWRFPYQREMERQYLSSQNIA